MGPDAATDDPDGSAFGQVTMLANFIAFQIGWFACVLGGAHDRPWLGTGIALVIVAVHVARAARPRDEAILVVLCAGIGFVFDSALVSLGWVAYPSGVLAPGTAPHWIVALWMLFATTLNVSLRWLRRMPAAAFGLGALGGPLAYWGGARLGGMTFAEPLAATVALAIGWAVLTPVMVGLSRRFDGFPASAPAGASAAGQAAFRGTR
jgi:hypothetical protein